VLDVYVWFVSVAVPPFSVYVPLSVNALHSTMVNAASISNIVVIRSLPLVWSLFTNHMVTDDKSEVGYEFSDLEEIVAGKEAHKPA